MTNFEKRIKNHYDGMGLSDAIRSLVAIHFFEHAVWSLKMAGRIHKPTIEELELALAEEINEKSS